MNLHFLIKAPVSFYRFFIFSNSILVMDNTDSMVIEMEPASLGVKQSFLLLWENFAVFCFALKIACQASGKILAIKIVAARRSVSTHFAAMTTKMKECLQEFQRHWNGYDSDEDEEVSILS